MIHARLPIPSIVYNGLLNTNPHSRRQFHPLLHHIGDSRDELSVGGFSLVHGNGVAKVFLQNVQVSPAPGYFDEVTDGPLKIPFIGIFMA